MCNKTEVAFKPRHSFLAELGGYAEKEDWGGDWWCAGPEDDKKDDKNWWRMIVQMNIFCNKNLTPPVFTKVKNMFSILSTSTDHTMNTNVPILAPSPIALATDNKTVIPPGPREYCRQQKWPDTSTSNRHYNSCERVTTCLLTTASLMPQTNAPPLPRATPTIESVWQLILPMCKNAS